LNSRSRLIAIVIVVIVVAAAIGWGVGQWSATEVAEPEKAEATKPKPAKPEPEKAEPVEPEPEKVEAPKTAPCDVVLKGTKAEIVGHPESVVFKATGPAVRVFSVKSVDTGKLYDIANVRIDGGKAISISKPSGKYDLRVRAKSMTPVQLAAEAKCPGR